MKRNHERYNRFSRNSGLTLLEVLASLVILSTLLTGLLMAKGRAERQHAMADRRLKAIAAADALVAGWWARSAVPLNDVGEISNHPTLRWQTRTAKAVSEGSVRSFIVRVEVVDAADKSVLAVIDLWMPDESSEPPPQMEADR